jgi:signal transduction histidine kinase
MSVLIRDLSDINRIESGRMKFELGSFGLDEALEDVISSLRETIDGRQQMLMVEIEPDFPQVYADRTRISQVLTNLISNANKYTPNGGEITVRASANGQFAQLEVVDTGIGISEEDQAKLFTQFFRSDDSAVREQTGWGLGLSIVKKMVEAQGGEISCYSILGQGSTFTFTIPLANSV